MNARVSAHARAGQTAEAATQRRREDTADAGGPATPLESLQRMMDGSPHVAQLQALAEQMNNGPRAVAQAKLVEPGENGGTSGDEVVQRVVTFHGATLRTMKDIANDKQGAWDVYMGSKDGGKRAKLDDPDRVYDLANGLADVTDQVGGPEQLEEAYQPNPRALDDGPESFGGASSYNVTLGEGAGFLGTDEIQILGTEGLSGCVAVMVKSRGQAGQGYFLAHVYSGLHGKEQAIRAELDKIIQAVSELIQSEVQWGNFDVTDDSDHELTLVRAEPGPEERLYIDMVGILSGLGAKFFEAVSPKVFFDIGNPENEYGSHRPGTSISRAPSSNRTSGYGPTMAEQDAAERGELQEDLGGGYDDYDDYQDLYGDEPEYEPGELGYEDENDIEDGYEADDDLSPEELEEQAREDRYQQYARELGDI